MVMRMGDLRARISTTLGTATARTGTAASGENDAALQRTPGAATALAAVLARLHPPARTITTFTTCSAPIAARYLEGFDLTRCPIGP